MSVRRPLVFAGGNFLLYLRTADIAELFRETFDLEIFSYITTADGNVFVRTQSELLLKFLEVLSDLGIQFAVPLQEAIVAANVSANEQQDSENFLKMLGVADGKNGKE